MGDIFEELDRRKMWHLAEFGKEPDKFRLTEQEHAAFVKDKDSGGSRPI